MTTNTINNAIKFMRLLSPEIVECWDKTNITSWDTIEIDFWKNDRLVSCEVGETKIGLFTTGLVDNNFISTGEEFDGLEIPKIIQIAFYQLLEEI